jgi:Arc/MetJ-type ribon-helix-helix transcriptional regulator
MKLTLSSDAEQMIQEQLRSKKFADAEAVILAALKSLSAAAPDEFETGELRALLGEGEESIAREGTLDADEALAVRRARREHPKSGAA